MSALSRTSDAVNARHAAAGNASTGPAPFCFVSRTPTTALPEPTSTHWPPSQKELARHPATSTQLPVPLYALVRHPPTSTQAPFAALCELVRQFTPPTQPTRRLS